MMDGESSPPVLVERQQPLSHSLVWKLQRAFFDQQGVQAWGNGIVPHHITTNPFIARAYAAAALGFLRDCSAREQAGPGEQFPLDLDQPIYMIELGAGSGRFGFSFLKRLSDLLCRSSLKRIRICYVMTDFSPRMIGSWRSHTLLQPFIEQGLLDFALFDAEQPGPLLLLHAGITLAPGTLANPPIILANYVFDSLPQDVFLIKEGQLHEALVNLSLSDPAADLDDPAVLPRLEISYEYRPTSADYYADPDFNAILHTYQQRLAETHVLFPRVALECLRYFREISHGRFFLLSADKGYIQEDELLHQGAPVLAFHGCFSLMVNYHAIGQYILGVGGLALAPAHRHLNLGICGFLCDMCPDSYPETSLAFHTTFATAGPDDFFMLMKGVEQHYATLSLEQILACLRLSNWDPRVFLGCFQALLEYAESAPLLAREEICFTVHQVWAAYYPIGEQQDLPFHLAMLLYSMRYYPEALVYLQRSEELYGPDPSTCYNMAMCHYCLRQLDAALAALDRTLALDPQFEEAKSLRIRLQAELGRRSR